MYEEYLKTGSIHHVTNELNLRRAKTARGKPFASSTVRRILTSELYKGVLVYNRHSLQSGRKLKRKAEEHIRFTVPELAIVSEDTWDAVQKLIAKNANIPRMDDTQHLLGGLIYCSKCGYKMHGYTSRNKIKKHYRYYRCNGHISGGSAICKGNTIRADLLESIIEEELTKLSLNPQSVYEYANEQMLEADHEIKELLGRRDELQAEITKIQNKIMMTLELYYDGVLTREQLVQKKEALDADALSRTGILQEINDRIQLSSYQQIDLEAVVQKVANFKDVYDKLAFQDRKELVRSLIGRITVHEHEVQYEVIALPIVTGKANTNGVLEQDRMGTDSWQPPA
jgi:site-specific DNA recombinase